MIKRSTQLKDVIEVGKVCNKCGHCCKFGTAFMIKDDVARIAKHLKMDKGAFKKKYLTKTDYFNTTIFKINGKEGPRSDCVFFSKAEGCTIHSVKPLFCKVTNRFAHSTDLISWFYLNHLVNPEDPESIRQYKVYLESGGKLIPGGKLEDIVPDRERLKKMLSYELL